MPLADVYNYFRSYDKESYEVYTQQGCEPNLEAVVGFENLVGLRLPDEFREFAVHPLGGLYMAAREKFWPRPQPYHVGPWWSFAYAILVFGFSTQAPKGMRIGEAWQRMSERGHPEFVPFFKMVGDPESYCFDAEKRIVVWSYDLAENPRVVPGTFSEFVMKQIQDLENRMARKKRGEDKNEKNVV